MTCRCHIKMQCLGVSIFKIRKTRSFLIIWIIRYYHKLLLEEICLENDGMCFRKYCKKIFSFILVSSEKSWKSANQNVLIFMSVYLHLKLWSVFFFSFFFLFIFLFFLFFCQEFNPNTQQEKLLWREKQKWDFFHHISKSKES